jgi:hypothetical protein
VSASPFVRVDRAKLHALIEAAADVIDGATIDGMLALLGGYGEDVPKNDLEALWRQAGVACLIGMQIYDNADDFLEHKVYGENGRAS